MNRTFRMKKLATWISRTLLILVVACTHKPEPNQNQNELSSSASTFSDITLTDFDLLTESADSTLLILDVRTDREFQAGHIPNAIQIDFMSPDFKSKAAELDTTKTYIVYCQSGGRSAAASTIMVKELGFIDVKNLADGYSGWSSKSE